MPATLSPAEARAAAGGGLRRLFAGNERSSEVGFHLEVLAQAGATTELRYRRQVGMGQEFFTSPGGAAERALELAASTDVYMGVLPRVGNSGTRAGVVPEGRTLWCDCDNEMAVERALAWGMVPHLVVQSSPGKAHLYWLLNKGLPLDLIERGNRRLAFLFGGDLRAADAARILRPAGTFNHKRKGTPRLVSLVRVNDEVPTYAPRDLVAPLMDPCPPKVKAPARAQRTQFADPDKDALLSVRSPEYVSRLTGREVAGGFVQCPFHGGGQERTPSLHAGGPQDRFWKCFGCDEGGDIFSLAGLMWGLSTRDDFPAITDRLLKEFR